jgi:4-hydroxyphenylacetate 3-monooxygenase
LRAQPRQVFIDGRRLSDVTAYPGFRGILQSIAGLYDYQLQPRQVDEMTWRPPDSGEAAGISFMPPKTRADLERRARASRLWALQSNGMLGRTPDYLNSALMAFAAARDFFGQADARFGENITAYERYVREHDLCLTHTLVNPQANRSTGPSGQADPFLAARVKEERDDGLIIQGARILATLGPVADELLVFPSTLIKHDPSDAPYSVAFAVPCGAPGLTFICRESHDLNRPTFDHPISSRFDEIDALVVFDDVFVPWERVFLYGDAERANAVFGATNAVVHMAMQVLVKNIVKTEYVLGLASLIIETIAIEPFQHVHEKVAEIIVGLESLRGLLGSAIDGARTDQWGIMAPAREPLDAARNLYPRLYPRFVEIIQQLSASGLMAIPTLADLDGEAGPDIERYLTAARGDARERLALFRLAWDTAASMAAGRQTLYERFFFGDPVRMAGTLFNTYDRRPYMERVRGFIQEGIDEGAETTGVD